LFGLPKIIQQLQQSEEDLRKIVLCVERGGGAVGIVMNVLQEVVEVRFGPEARSLLAEGRLGTVLAEAHNPGPARNPPPAEGRNLQADRDYEPARPSGHFLRW
jgi:Uncharacterised BCR, YbaB family COG0718.